MFSSGAAHTVNGWPGGITAMTIAFGIGQTLGPIAVGAITDALGSLSYALNVSAALLALGRDSRDVPGEAGKTITTVVPGWPTDQTSDAQLRIGESSRFRVRASRAPE